ncbi:hypothetical protein [Planctellipticum variicoloris]|uniref:hypothetical protein n=1 Tax=Planctellipticum variicoloris TaxID=3064265 RepID=UPI0030135C67|nr:hypothetical protein SH412_004161 [Planctomycetaceae bacterium SH412]
MREIHGVMVTMTTYGTWLRGDPRGWVDDGITYPADPELENADRERLKYPVYRFDPSRWHEIGGMLGRSLIDRLQQRVLALTVQTWHVHFVVGPSRWEVPWVVKCAKEAVRYGLRPGRPIWTVKYDKRFCFSTASLMTRIAYVERHNTERGWAAKPWDFIELP